MFILIKQMSEMTARPTLCDKMKTDTNEVNNFASVFLGIVKNLNILPWNRGIMYALSSFPTFVLSK